MAQLMTVGLRLKVRLPIHITFESSLTLKDVPYKTCGNFTQIAMEKFVQFIEIVGYFQAELNYIHFPY